MTRDDQLTGKLRAAASVRYNTTTSSWFICLPSPLTEETFHTLRHMFNDVELCRLNCGFSVYEVQS